LTVFSSIFLFLNNFLGYILLFYRFESKWDIRLRLVDKDFWTRLGFWVFFKQSGTLKSPTLAQSLFRFLRKVSVLFSSKYFIDESDRDAVFD